MMVVDAAISSSSRVGVTYRIVSYRTVLSSQGKKYLVCVWICPYPYRTVPLPAGYGARIHPGW